MKFSSRSANNPGIGFAHPPALQRGGTLANGLIFYAALSEQGELGAFEAVSSLRQSSGIIHPGISPAGYARYRSDPTSNLVFGFFDRYKLTTGPFTFAVYGLLDTGATAYNVISNTNSVGGANQVRILTNYNESAASSGAMTLFTYDGSSSVCGTTSVIDAGRPHWYIGLRTNAGTLQLWRDAVLMKESTGLTARNVSGSTTQSWSMGLGTTNSNGRGITRGSAWNRALTPAEIAALVVEPDGLTTVNRVYFDVAASAGSQTLLPSLVTDSDTFHAPTVSVGAVTLTPSLVTDGDTFYAATVTTGVLTLQPSLVTDADTFHSPTVSVGAVTLQPSLVTDGDTFHAPTVSVGAVTLQPSLVTDGDTFYSPTVTVDGGPQTLLPALFEDGDTFHSATVTTGAVTLQPSLVTDADTFHSPTVTSGLLLQPSLVTDDDTFHSPTVTVGAVDLTPALFVNSQSFYVPTVSADGSPQTLTASLVTNDATFYAHEVVRQILAGEATDSRHRARIGGAIAGASLRIGTPIAGPKRRIGKSSP